MDDDGKMNGKLPVFNDLLTFVWNKMNISPLDALVNLVKLFYKQEEVFKARDVLFSSVPDTGKRVKHRKVEDVLQGVYSIMLALPTVESPIFLALNLNNLPCLDVKNMNGAALICQQSKLSETIKALNRAVVSGFAMGGQLPLLPGPSSNFVEVYKVTYTVTLYIVTMFIYL